MVDTVRALDDMVMGVPADWKPLAEMDDLSPEVTRLVDVTVRRIIRTARSRTSGENGGVRFVMAPVSQGQKPPENPARFT